MILLSAVSNYNIIISTDQRSHGYNSANVKRYYSKQLFLLNTSHTKNAGAATIVSVIQVLSMVDISPSCFALGYPLDIIIHCNTDTACYTDNVCASSVQDVMF